MASATENVVRVVSQELLKLLKSGQLRLPQQAASPKIILKKPQSPMTNIPSNHLPPSSSPLAPLSLASATQPCATLPRPQGSQVSTLQAVSPKIILKKPQSPMANIPSNHLPPSSSPVAPLSLASATQPCATPSRPQGSQVPKQLALQAASTQKADWTLAETKAMLDLAVLLVHGEKKRGSVASWDELAKELQLAYSGKQCRDKYFNINKGRRKTVQANHTSGNAPKALKPEEEYLHDLLQKMKDPPEVPEEEIVNCSSNMLPPQNEGEELEDEGEGLSAEADSDRSQGAVLGPYKKKPKRKHGSGTSQAVVRNTLQQQWIAFLKNADSRQKERDAREAKKAELREDTLNARKERAAIKREQIKLEKARMEFKRKKYEESRVFRKKMLEMEEEKLTVMKGILRARGDLQAYD